MSDGSPDNAPGRGNAKLRGAVVGCGKIAAYHLRAWRRLAGVEIVALADPAQPRAVERRDAYFPAAAIHPHIDSVLERERIDFIDILTPPWLHREHCLKAAEKGIHIACQKPLCDRLEEAEALVRKLASYPKRFCVHENHPHRPWFRDTLALHREGFFGDSLKLTLTHHAPSEPPETFKIEAEKGILLDYGVHLVAMARALLGEPRALAARLGRVNPRVKGESQATLEMEFPAGTATIDVSWQDNGPFRGGFSLLGDLAEAHLAGSLTRGEPSRLRIERAGERLRDETRDPTEDFAESFYLFQKEFVEAIERGGAGPQPAEDNLKTLRCVFEAYE